MLFSCIFQTFCKNLHNFWTHDCFHINFGILMQKYILYKPWKFETKIFIFGEVIEISLGDCFFGATLYIFHDFKPHRWLWNLLSPDDADRRLTWSWHLPSSRPMRASAFVTWPLRHHYSSQWRRRNDAALLLADEWPSILTSTLHLFELCSVICVWKLELIN